MARFSIKGMTGGILSPSEDFRKQVEENYRLTTAEILYHIPDYPTLLQSFIWQEFDQIPKFPMLRKFIHFWQKEVEGKLYRVRIATVSEVRAADYAVIGQEIILN